jgi:hypothetical protein
VNVIALSHHREARLWLADRPALLDGPVQAHLPAPHGTVTPIRSEVAVEVAIPHGAHISYGLLGATWLPDAEGVTVLSRPDGPPYASPLVFEPDRAWVGLPHEFVDAVTSAAATAGDALPARGGIVFDAAANSAVGSSEQHFALLTRIVLALLAADVTDPAAAVAQLLDTYR